ncbi:YppG family protein [Halobacillus sp. A5]|uniref:YppG family protein n=1 Tax=Halobacillus sp. A5 TaxID=2880263 RepID=UPI0020A65D31|nr:YppG family protein [Halobacillus sp. A5]MCP3029251.1 YppG family protein [Halobacillus sp. A5]
MYPPYNPYYWQPPQSLYGNEAIDRSYNELYNQVPYGWDPGMYQAQGQPQGQPQVQPQGQPGIQAQYMQGYGYPGYYDIGAYGMQKKKMMAYFQDENGQMDFDKMMNTTGQVVQTIQQVSPMVKGIGSFVKGLR